MDRPFELTLGEFKVKVSDGEELLSIWPPRDAKAWAAYPPVFRTRRADHLTIPLKPLRDGPRAGRWQPHLTYSAKDRHNLADLPFDVVTVKLQSISDELGRRTRRLLQSTSPEELEATGYRLVAPPRKWMRKLANAGERFLLRKIRVDYLKVDKRFLRHWWRKLLVSYREVSPLALHSRWAKKSTQPLQVVHPYLEAAFVYYVPAQVRWVLGPRDMSKVVEEIVSAVLGPHLYEVMLVIFRELQIPCDVDDLVRQWGADAVRDPTSTPMPASSSGVL